MKKLVIFIVGLLLAGCSLSAMAQGIYVTGTVTDENGAALPGASVVLKGITRDYSYTNESVTDINGKYSIIVPGQGNFKVSFSIAGYEPKDFLDNQRFSDITLTPKKRQTARDIEIRKELATEARVRAEIESEKKVAQTREREATQAREREAA